MPKPGAVAAFTLTMSAAVTAALALQTEEAVGGEEAVDIREASIDRLLTADVKLTRGHAYVRQLHIGEDGELLAVTLGVGAPNDWLGAVLPDQGVSVLADEAMYSLSTDNILVMETADSLLARPDGAMPLERPVPVEGVAPAAVFGADVRGAPLSGDVRVAEVLGGRGIERLRIQSVDFYGAPLESRVVEAECARFIPITRVVDLSACEA
ncbi:MAG: hypothetical protein ACFE0P_08355 [Oceanicaulis sp.]